MKKKSLMLAGLITTGVAVTTGCRETFPGTEITNEENLIMGEKECFVVLRINDTDVLHKGTVEYMESSWGTGSVSLGYNSYKFNCGETYVTNAQGYVSENKPDKKVYDEICEECLSEEKGIN